MIEPEKMAEFEARVDRTTTRREAHEARCRRCAEGRECSTLHRLVDAQARADASLEFARTFRPELCWDCQREQAPYLPAWDSRANTFKRRCPSCLDKRKAARERG